jgi:hypothetical protein
MVGTVGVCLVSPGYTWSSTYHVEGGFGVTFNDVTKDADFYSITSRFVAWVGVFTQERQGFWFPG